MPPKSRKRRVTPTAGSTASNGTVAVPDRVTWPGWVEMESEPAFFNVMLKDMGVRGVKIQEVYGLDDEALAILPQPVHALIFLFRYRETDKDILGKECPPHVWYAEQVPDFACASVALLNIINNIPDLQMGKELRDFKDFTQDMDPHSRGDAIDDFTFLKQIHNSFANDTDILEADMCYQEKIAAANKRQAVAKTVKTKAAKAAAKAACNEKSNTATPTKSPVPEALPAPRTASKVKDSPAPNPSATPTKSANGTPASGRQTRSSSKLERTVTASATPEPNTRKSTPSKGAAGTPVPHELTNGSTKREDDSRGKTFKTIGIVDDSASELTELESSPVAKAKANQGKRLKFKATKPKPDPDGDFGSSTKTEPLPQARRSGRTPKPRKNLGALSETEGTGTGTRKRTSKGKVAAVEAEAEEEGFHFCAYMPIGDHVWKLDGMDKFPQDMGAIDLNGGQTWLNIAQPEIQARMLNYEEGAIEFNLMSLVHDPLITNLDDLAVNVRAIQEIETRLTGIVDDWKEMEATETGAEVVLGPSAEIGITQLDINRAPISDKTLAQLDAASEDLLKLLNMRKDRISQQTPLRAACRDEMESASRDAEHARHRRHDYLGFVRQWMEALADQQQLRKALEGVI